MYNENMSSPKQEIVGPSIDVCREKLFEKYGYDYQIIDKKRELKGGFLGIGQKEYWHLYYIVNSNKTQKPQYNATPAQMAYSSPAQYPANNSHYSGTYEDEKDAFRQNRDNILRNQNPDLTSTFQIAQLTKKLDEFTEAMNEKLTTITENSSSQEIHKNIHKIEELLMANEFSREYTEEIITRIKKEFSIDQLDDFETLQKTVVDWIGEEILVKNPENFRPPHVIIVIGPTGVGKTTTIAKLAANIILDAKNKNQPRPAVRLVTIDMMRVGATVQLERYGEIMNVPVDKAESMEDLNKIFSDYRNQLDYILIDTSGFSPNDYESIGKMRAELEVPGLNPDVYLAVTAGTKSRDLEKIIKNYEPFNFKSIIITKCDETSTYGNILSVTNRLRKPVSWITNGQIVPYYIERATKIKFLTSLVDFQIDRQHIEDVFNSQQ